LLADTAECESSARVIMEGEGEREQETNRLIGELQELLSSPSEPDDLPEFDAVGAEFFPAGFHNHMPLHVRTNVNVEHTAGVALGDSRYREKLRSFNSLPTLSSPAVTLSDTSSQCTSTDMMDVMYEQSLSDGGHRRRLRPQARQRRGSTRGPSRRSYECVVCGKRFPSPQSLGGHKNLHRTRGRNSSARRRGSAAPTVDQAGGNSGNSSESEGGASVYKGVRCREGDKWVTEIRPPRSSEKWWLGTFPSAEEAAQAYDVALAFFKSESELNFGDHPLYHTFPPLPPDLPSPKFAQRLREMVREISAQIIAERRSEEQATGSTPSPLGRPPAAHASPAGSSTSTCDPTTLQADDPPLAPASPPPPLPATELEWIKYLNLS
jgi:hypothetical protein